MRSRPVLVAASLALLAGAVPAAAETLFGALATSYATNPELNAARAELRAVDEGVSQAVSAFRPNVQIDASVTTTRSHNPFFADQTDRATAGISFEQPIFRGFRAVNALDATRTTVLLYRERLRGLEQQVLLGGVIAYADVMRDRAIRGLYAQNVAVLGDALAAAEIRMNAGEGTRTDVAEAEALLRAAEGDAAGVDAVLVGSIASYVATIGTDPDNLAAAAPIDDLIPTGVELAVEIALSNHPSILGARYNVQIAELEVEIAEGDLLPTASLFGELSATHNAGGGFSWENEAVIGGRLTMPIFTGGRESSEVREAKNRLRQRELLAMQQEAIVRAQVITAFGQMAGAIGQLRAAEAQVAAMQRALEAIEEEVSAGQATQLDIYQVRRSLLEARVRLVAAQRDRVVASYSIAAAVGLLTAEALGLPVEVYDVYAHYEAVDTRWFGLNPPTPQP
ncbi:MAG: TolC family outer membrane protein [Bauldia sp.]|nr:TolC family outer membrane protein [Bauldia sp.]